MPTINVRGTTLHYERAGTGDPTLVFVHGMCGGAWSWEDQLSRVSDRFTCVAYDRRGHSRSPAGPGDPVEDQSDETHAEDAAALIDGLGLERPVVVGSSSGAAVAIELLHRHETVAGGAVLSEPPLFSIDASAGSALRAEIGPAIERAAETGGPRAAVDAFFSLICPGLWSQLDEKGRDRYRDNAPLLFATLQARTTTVTTTQLGEIGVPVLVVSGAASHPVLRSVAALLARSLPDARFVEFAGSGHVTHAEKPAEFARAVTGFADQASEGAQQS